jgi:hypothetical protein
MSVSNPKLHPQNAGFRNGTWRGGVPCCHHAAITLLKRSAAQWYRTVLPGQTLQTPAKRHVLRRRVLPPITGCASDSLLAVPTDLLLNHPHRPRPLCTTTLTRSRQASKQSINQSIDRSAKQQPTTHIMSITNAIAKINTLTPPISNSSHPNPLIGPFSFFNATHGLLPPSLDPDRPSVQTPFVLSW